MKSLLENLVLVMQRIGTGILREASSPTYLRIFSWNKISGEWSIRDGQAHLDSVETHGREFYPLWFLGKRMDGKWSFWVSLCHSGPTYLCSCLLGRIFSAGPAFFPGDYFCPFYLQFLLHYWFLLKHSHVHSPYSFNRDRWEFLCNKPSVSSRNTVGNKPSYLVTSLRRRWTVKKSCRLWLMPWRKYQPEQNRVLWFVLSFLLQLALVDHSLLNSLPLASIQHTLAGFLLFLSRRVRDRSVFLCPALGDPSVFSPLTLSLILS